MRKDEDISEFIFKKKSLVKSRYFYLIKKQSNQYFFSFFFFYNIKKICRGGFISNKRKSIQYIFSSNFKFGYFYKRGIRHRT